MMVFLRDTWASNIMQQLNWWMPLEEIDEGRTMCFYPELFDRAVPNTSTGWDLDELRARRKRGLPYPQLPELDHEGVAKDPLVSELMRPKYVRPLVGVRPGDVVVFSGAHLHSSVVNTTGLTRYSCEIRSVDARDLRKGIGAPNVDGEAARVPLHWFRNVDNQKLKLTAA
uniref:Phytanoyl-CoA dioxygenase n=1 Tax=Chloropicon primus TaxID=1764295 RepID=A0A7S2WXC1_9CHLO|mmetsp:Transcript_10199/g.28866  ORF Transcript_10199/g.28866 Transcript_10199/m.28866 type:complete len:170 (+) Transcript_10199:446-955(+)